MKLYILLVAMVVLMFVGTTTAESDQKDNDDLDNIDDKESLHGKVGDDEDEFGEDDDDDEEAKSNLLSMFLLNSRDSVCDGKAKGSCNKKGGSCVTSPFKENCLALLGPKGQIKKKACKSKDCQCCAPPPSCDGMIKKPCSKSGGFCVVKPFKTNCKGGELHTNKKACKSKNCQCCIPGPTTPQPVTTVIVTQPKTTVIVTEGTQPPQQPETTIVVTQPKTTIIVTEGTQPPVLESCPAPYELRGDECFFVHEDKNDLLNWDESRQRCLSMGGDLAQPQDMVDFVKYIKENHPNSKSTIWLGATDREIEQTWNWVSGEPVPTAMWKPWPDNQPSGDGNCMEIHYWPHTDFYMNDWYCHNKGHFACEFNMAS